MSTDPVRDELARYGDDTSRKLKEKRHMIQERFDLMIGRLDRILSELLQSSKLSLDTENTRTLKHHAEDMILAGQAILARVDPLGKANTSPGVPGYVGHGAHDGTGPGIVGDDKGETGYFITIPQGVAREFVIQLPAGANKVKVSVDTRQPASGG